MSTEFHATASPPRITVVGLGYVGLTTALLAARAGFFVVGVDASAERRALIERGQTPFSAAEPELHALCMRMVHEGRLRVQAEVPASDMVLVAVPTPVNEHGTPDLSHLRAALREVAARAPGLQLLVVESTLAPGTMRTVVAPLFDQARARIAHAPERVMPGKLVHNATTLTRVVGVESDAAWDKAAALYERVFGAPLRRTSWANAELVKTAENAWRDMSIAFANTLAIACEAAGGDFEEVRARVNESPGRDVLKAGVGVGGSCLPKDSHLLGVALGENRFLREARAVNESMPLHAATLAATCLGGAVSGKRVLVLGASYLENVHETSHSPALAFAEHLRRAGAEVQHHDPHVPGFQGNVEEMAAGCDLLALATDHAEYASLDYRQLRALAAPTSCFLDLRCSAVATLVEQAGWTLFRLGRAHFTRE